MGSIDADAHVIESEATFRFLDPQYKHLEPIPITRKESDAAEHAVDGRKLGADGRVPAAVAKKILDDNARTLYGL